jgi:iduronate 2-sulfatase
VSPVGGVGINDTIQDAIVTAGIVRPAMLPNSASSTDEWLASSLLACLRYNCPNKIGTIQIPRLCNSARLARMNTATITAFTAALILTLNCGVAGAGERPDVLLIVIDDLRPMLGCYGDPHVKTPHIDRLAQRSVVFDRAYCQYAKCGTSRLSLMTGLRPDSIGVFSNRDKDVDNFRNRRPAAAPLGKWLEQHGYFTQSFGKIDHDGWDVATDWSVPASPGRAQEMLEIADPADPTQPTLIADRIACPAIQSPDVPDEHLFAGRMTRQVLKTMKERDADQPIFLAVGYRRPHLPLVAPKRYFDLYQPDDSWLAKNPAPADGSPVLAWFNSDGYVGTARKIGLTMPSPPNHKQAVDWNGYELRSYLGVPNHGTIDQRLQLEILQAYAACVSYVDTQVGRLLTELKTSGRLQNTVVILCSDHGWHLGEQSAWGKMTNFEIATRVPLLIAAPNIQPARTRSFAELVDLYPTICELTGMPAPPHLEGESLLPTLREPQNMMQQIALSQYARQSTKYMGRAIRTDRFRFVRWEETKGGEIVSRELYDHETDPLETTNRAEHVEYSNHVMRLEGLLQHSFRK